jgi:hypothetical protein
MNRSASQRVPPIGRRAIVTLALASVIGMCAFLVLALPVAAQATASGTDVIASMVITDTTSTDQVPAETPENGGKIVTEHPVPSATQALSFVIVVLIFALLAMAAVLLYNYSIQNRFYTVSENLGRAGKSVKAVAAPAPLPTIRGREEAFREGEAQPETPPPGPVLHIDGPGVVTVGAQSTDYKATIDGKAADTATWTVEPANLAIVIPPTGASVKVVAAVAGAFTLSAAVAGPPAASGKVQVAAIAPQNVPIELPFVGGGYGSIIIAIVLLATVIVLGLAAVLSGEAVATLLGGLLGYIFGVGASKKSGNQAD